jgi:hypothetical protein
VHSTLHKFFLDSGYHKPEFSSHFKGRMVLRIVVLGRETGENHDLSVPDLNMNSEI